MAVSSEGYCSRIYHYSGVDNLIVVPISYVSVNYCEPTHWITLNVSDFSYLKDSASYTGEFKCFDEYGGSYDVQSVNVTFPCTSDYISVKPVEYFSYFKIKPGYVEHPSFSSYEEYFVMSQEQIDLILVSLLVLTCCIAWCMGFSANEGSAK